MFLALLGHVSWNLPACLAIVLQMRGLAERSGPVPSALLLLWLSWSLIVIKLFKPKRKITIILVCVRLACVRRLWGEAPFPAAGTLPQAAQAQKPARAGQGGLQGESVGPGLFGAS